MTGILRRWRVACDSRRKPYSSEYSTMYSSCGHTADRDRVVSWSHPQHGLGTLLPRLQTFCWCLRKREVLAVVQGIGTTRRLEHLGLNVQLKLQAQGTEASVEPAGGSPLFHWVSDLKTVCPEPTHLDGAVGEHLHSKLFFLQLQAPGLQLQAAEAPITELQDDRCPARVVAHLHPQDTLPWPSISNVLQAVDGGPGEDNVYVGEDEKHKQGLGGVGGRAVSSGKDTPLPPGEAMAACASLGAIWPRVPTTKVPCTPPSSSLMTFRPSRCFNIKLPLETPDLTG